jgi:uncharacterized protein YndB with AHSA1/START domain
MPKVSRNRVIAAPRERVWEMVSDPHHLPRWWPRVRRVEDVREVQGRRRSQWTAVLATDRGGTIRADFRCISSAENERYVWEQEVDGTPFERILRSSTLGIHLTSAQKGTGVQLASEERLRGLSRLGSFLMRRATRQKLDEALQGLERALVGTPG